MSLEPPPPVVPEVEPPEAPMELVLPDVLPLPAAGEVLALELPDVSLPGVVLPPVLALVLPPVEPEVAGVVVSVAGVLVDELVDVEGVVAVSSRLVQAPRETAATRASAAHEVSDLFIEGISLGYWCQSKKAACAARNTTLGPRFAALVGPCRRRV
jgi:hypothetical protein